MKKYFIVIPILVVALMAGCKQKGAGAADEEFAPVQSVEPQDESQDESNVELVPVLRKAQPSQNKAKGVATTAKTNAPAVAKKPTKAEAIYVETDGAQGRVWGHVTMNGDRGTGTIHDWDENTWAVNVTRHGDELFAVDQNSRLYVFKLKQK